MISRKVYEKKISELPLGFWWILVENKKDCCNGGMRFLGVGCPSVFSGFFYSNVCSFLNIMKVIFLSRGHISLRVDPLFQKKKGSTKQRAKACYEVSGFLET